jgi:hypothetical protein
MALTYVSWEYIQRRASNVKFSSIPAERREEYEDFGDIAQSNIDSILSKRFSVPLRNISATIIGDNNIFTGVVGDTIKVTLNSVVYDDIDISACTSILSVANIINIAIATNIASVSNGFLKLESSIGDIINISISDGTSTITSCVDRLFTTAIRSAIGENLIPIVVKDWVARYSVGLIKRDSLGMGEGLKSIGTIIISDVEKEIEQILYNSEPLKLPNGVFLHPCSTISVTPDDTEDYAPIFQRTVENYYGSTDV